MGAQPDSRPYGLHGGTADSASDPWISVGPDGTAYFLGIELNLRGDLVNPPSAIVASRSHDGGRTWTRPVTVSGFEPVNDTDAITASPTRAGQAYAAWANWDHTGNFQFPSSVKFSRTTDGGATWSRPVAVDLPGPGFVDVAPRLVVLPDGTLMAVYTQADLAAGIGRLYVTRSVDEGRTWLPPVLAGSQPIQISSIPRQAMVLPAAGIPQRRGRSRRHRLCFNRTRQLGDLGRDNRGAIEGRRPHLDQQRGHRRERVRVLPLGRR